MIIEIGLQVSIHKVRLIFVSWSRNSYSPLNKIIRLKSSYLLFGFVKYTYWYSAGSKFYTPLLQLTCFFLPVSCRVWLLPLLLTVRLSSGLRGGQASTSFLPMNETVPPPEHFYLPYFLSYRPYVSTRLSRGTSHLLCPLRTLGVQPAACLRPVDNPQRSPLQHLLSQYDLLLYLTI